MRLILGSLLSAVLVAGCSSVPVQERADSCDYARMDQVERARQPLFVERYWVHCPQPHKSSS
jgi:hypothetical protein